jgi:hypothetical protein
MKAQLYDDADYVRVFDMKEHAWRQAIMDCYSYETASISTDAADLALKRCGLVRKSKWQRLRAAKMFEANVSFRTR